MALLDLPDEQASSDKAAALLRELDRWTGSRCSRCRHELCGHEVLFSVLLGAKDAPRCLSCLAVELARLRSELRNQVADFVQHRDCYRHAWNVASLREGRASGPHPSCLWPEGKLEDATAEEQSSGAYSGADIPSTASDWDAGDMACGELVLALRGRLNALPAGAVLKVTACDPAAHLDLPAWCRLTGHRLLTARHPEYYIQRKEA